VVEVATSGNHALTGVVRAAATVRFAEIPASAARHLEALSDAIVDANALLSGDKPEDWESRNGA